MLVLITLLLFNVDTCGHPLAGEILADGSKSNYFLTVKAIDKKKDIFLVLTKSELLLNLKGKSISRETLLKNIKNCLPLFEIDDSTDYFGVISDYRALKKIRKLKLESALKRFVNLDGSLKTSLPQKFNKSELIFYFLENGQVISEEDGFIKLHLKPDK